MFDNYISDIEIVKKLIIHQKETDCVDFKRDFYKSLKNSDFPKDITSFANVTSNIDKYIIFGVDDNTKTVVGLSSNNFPTSDDFDDYISQTIEPFVNISFSQFEFEGKLVFFIKIFATNSNRPYFIKKHCGENNKLKIGDIYIRKGACCQKANKADVDFMYSNNGSLSFKQFEQYILIEPIKMNKIKGESPTYGHVDVEIINNSSKPYLIMNGFIEILDSTHYVKRCVHSVLPTINIQDRPFHIEPNTRRIATFLFDFTSQDCVYFDFDEFGLMDHSVMVRFILFDTDGKEYISDNVETFLKAKGDILHKVKLLKNLNRKR